MMQERLFSERTRIPTDHAGGSDSHPIDAASLAGNISANFLETLSPKNLALPRNIGLAFETVGCGIVSIRLGEYRAGNPKSPVLAELGEEKFEMIGVE